LQVHCRVLLGNTPQKPNKKKLGGQKTKTSQTLQTTKQPHKKKKDPAQPHHQGKKAHSSKGLLESPETWGNSGQLGKEREGHAPMRGKEGARQKEMVKGGGGDEKR